MEVIIPKMYQEYGRYITKFRALPYKEDLLRPVERRILLGVNQVAKKFTKSAKVVGHVMGKWHGHGDTSIYNTLVRMVLLKIDKAGKKTLIEGQGNFGADGIQQIEAAAMRYTEVKRNPLIDSLCFQYIDYVPWEELEMDKEPVFVPAPIPIGLLGDSFNQGIAFHRTIIPNYTIEDLTARLDHLLGKRRAITILPNYKNNEVLDTKGAKSILTSGSGTVTFIPKHEIKDNRTIAIHGLAVDKFRKMLKIPNIEVADLSTDKINILVTLPERGFHKLREKVLESITCSVKFECLVVTESGTVEQTSIDEMLLHSYRNFQSVVESYLQKQLAEELIRLDELKLILKIKKVLKKVHITSVDQLVNHFPEDEHEAVRRICSKYRIQTLVDMSTSVIDKCQTRIKEIKQNIKDIDTVAYQRFKDLIKEGGSNVQNNEVLSGVTGA